MLANRTKDLMELIVSDNQSASIPRRLIFDNIMISYEIMHFLKQKQRGNDECMALKLDVSKAYDRVEWGYLRAILQKMAFHDHWVSLIM